MNRPRLIRSALLLVAACLCARAEAQQALEIIPLRHRVADQVLPILRPLVEPGGTLVGQNNQLIVRTSAANLAQLKQALAAIDLPLRRLEISVRFDDATEAASRGIEASGRISDRDASVGLRARDARSGGTQRVDQRVQVLEGGRARLMAGRALAHDGFVREIATGFEAVPRLSGDRVFLDIAPQRETAGQQQRIDTSVSARLGEWFDVGGAVSSALRNEAGIASANRTQSIHAQRIWLKVEELRP